MSLEDYTMAGGKYSKKTAVALLREGQALELRLAGATYDVIATQLGISPMGAHKAVMRAFGKISKRNAETAQEVLRLELQRLDKMQLAIWSLAVNQKNLRAVDKILKIMERRSKLLGLDAPTKAVVGDLGEGQILHDFANSILDDPANQRLLDAMIAGKSRPCEDDANPAQREVGPA